MADAYDQGEPALSLAESSYQDERNMTRPTTWAGDVTEASKLGHCVRNQQGQLQSLLHQTERSVAPVVASTREYGEVKPPPEPNRDQSFAPGLDHLHTQDQPWLPSGSLVTVTHDSHPHSYSAARLASCGTHQPPASLTPRATTCHLESNDHRPPAGWDRDMTRMELVAFCKTEANVHWKELADVLPNLEGHTAGDPPVMAFNLGSIDGIQKKYQFDGATSNQHSLKELLARWFAMSGRHNLAELHSHVKSSGCMRHLKSVIKPN